MFVQIQNENYGYAVATYGDYVVVSNPSITRYNQATRSVFYSGSVDYFRYNKNTDEHDYIATIRAPHIDMDVLLAKEIGSDISYREGLQTEDTGSVERTNNKGLLIDKDRYTGSADDGFGLSLDMYNKQLIVGCPYKSEIVITSASLFIATGSSVHIYDLGLTEYTSFTPDSNILIYSIDNPDAGLSTSNTESFGKAVSINKDWVIIGSPFVSESKGMVYVYKNRSTGSNYSWSLYQKLEVDGDVVDAGFGYSLKLNKCTSSYSNSMVIGCSNISNSKAYYFELDNNVWKHTYTFNPDYTVYPLSFGTYVPLETGPFNVGCNGFGMSVSLYDGAVIIGEPFDRQFHEFAGSTLYRQGSVSIFERCSTPTYLTNSIIHSPVYFEQVLKTYGTPSTIKNNLMGLSVDIFGYNAIGGIPKLDVFNLTACYIGGSLNQMHQCNSDLENALNGQSILIQKNTSSLKWEITNVYQKRKRFLQPYRNYGFDVSIADKSMVIGSTMCLSGSNRQINLKTTASNNVTLGDIAGKAYIYNLKNLHDKFHVGNVFYRNGKIILMTSGSVFDGLFYNPVNTSDYEYDISFKSQHTIFEKQIICPISSGEFNVSTNPTALVFATSSFDINKNGVFDFQDLDIILQYMQYKNTSISGIPISTNWSSSIVTTDDEISLLKWYQENNTSDISNVVSESIIKWETTNTNIQDLFDLNQDNKIDINDMNILWKYFTNRLNQDNYASYITPACQRKYFSDIIDHLNTISCRGIPPKINPQFLTYEDSAIYDKTGSFLAPMVTSIGLYDGLDLVAIAKLGTPIKITPELPINFVVKMDF